jgi:hypothetical protein
MRFDGKDNKQEIQDLQLKKLSNVLFPAHGPAIAKIIKSEDVDKLSKKSFSEALMDFELSDAMNQFMDQVWTYNAALRKAIESILYNPEVTDKKTKIKENLSQFMAAMTTLTDSQDVIKSLQAFPGVKEIDVTKLSPEVLSMVDKVWINGKFIPHELLQDDKKKKKSTKKEDSTMSEELKKQIDQMQKRQDRTDKILALPATSRAYFDELAKTEDQDAFLAKSKEDQEKAVNEAAVAKKRLLDDEVLIVGNEQIKKSEVGPGVYALLKSQQSKLEQNSAELKKEQEARIQKELENEAATLWPNLPGTPADKADTLKAIRSLPTERQEAQMTMMKAANANAANTLTEIGHGNQEVVKGEDALKKLAKTIQEKEPELTDEQAYAKALKSDSGQKIYKQMNEIDE